MSPRRRGEAERDPRRQIRQHIGERVRPDQRTSPNSGGRRGAAARADEPIPAILGRPEDEIVVPEEAERGGDSGAARAGISEPTITTGPGGRWRGRAMRRPRSPWPCADRNAARQAREAAGLIRRQREAQRQRRSPPGDAAAARRRPVEAQRRGIADAAREAPLAHAHAARARRSRDARPASSRRAARCVVVGTPRK